MIRGDYLRDWLARGWADRMAYLHHQLDERTDPRVLLPGARSVIVAALNYHQPAPPRPADQPRGRVAMYAWGRDYHRLVRERLETMVAHLRRSIAEPFAVRLCVDTAPIVEREWAALAGVGWIGKNTMVVHERLGSYFFLGEVVTTLELQPDAPGTDHCGSCTRCLEACPTGAFPAPYQMNASRCISYVTIELHDEVPAEFHEPMDDWLFGCDVCQQVCPYNRRAPTNAALGIVPPAPYPALAEVAGWTAADYRDAVRGTARERAKLPMLKRNAAIALANASRANAGV